MRMPDANESGLRRLMADATGGEHRSFADLAAAKADPLGAAILEGDDGGQIYAVFPASMVECSKRALLLLLADLDGLRWDDEGMRRICFERRSVGSGVAGGMGGGVVEADGWVHQDFVDLGVADEVRSVVRGDLERISKRR